MLIRSMIACIIVGGAAITFGTLATDGRADAPNLDGSGQSVSVSRTEAGKSEIERHVKIKIEGPIFEHDKIEPLIIKNFINPSLDTDDDDPKARFYWYKLEFYRNDRHIDTFKALTYIGVGGVCLSPKSGLLEFIIKSNNIGLIHPAQVSIAHYDKDKGTFLTRGSGSRALDGYLPKMKCSKNGVPMWSNDGGFSTFEPCQCDYYQQEESDKIATKLFNDLNSKKHSFHEKVEDFIINKSDVNFARKRYDSHKVDDRDIKLALERGAKIGSWEYDGKTWGFSHELHRSDSGYAAVYMNYISPKYDNSDYVIIIRNKEKELWEKEFSWYRLHRQETELFAYHPWVYGFEGDVLKLNMCIDDCYGNFPNFADIELNLAECDLWEGKCLGKVIKDRIAREY